MGCIWEIGLFQVSCFNFQVVGFVLALECDLKRIKSGVIERRVGIEVGKRKRTQFDIWV